MEIHFKIIGVLLIALSFMHVIFPRYFNWSKELVSLSLVNRQMMYVHTFFIALVVFLIGVLCLTSSEELLSTGLGKKIVLGFGVFWSVRLLMQFFGYSSALWKGKFKETVIHIIFSLFWTYLTVIFFTSYWI
ncbi:hypothetical protein QG516_13855 [Pedobacter gandavensis]|uniref:hypothetical protein n=1 Tax=Pedobacter gandavensis TaxID=2679963 RepID=UPI002479440C|nr:hypothetical protein [Pedobacter gandavensis]WGQ07652.1 hypothetical protein QG516_13855 [Pedobacter gandavensis]